MASLLPEYALDGAFTVLVMLRSPVATNPYALTSNCLIALFMLSHFKHAGRPARFIISLAPA